MIRVATFNIRHGRAERGGVDLTGLAAAVRGLDAEVLGLQEIDVGVGRSGGVDEAALGAEAAGATAHHFAPALRTGGGWYGVAIAVRGELTDVEGRRLTGAGEPRVVTIGRVRLAAHEGPSAPVACTVAVTHLQAPGSGGTREARRQLEEVLDAIETRPGPHLLLGDLNLGPPAVEPVLSDRGYVAAEHPATYPARRPSRRIDWIAVRGGRVEHAWVPDVRASDHRPVVAGIVLGSSTRAAR